MNSVRYNEVEIEFIGKALVRGGVFLLRPSDAIDLINKCREKNYRVFGIDGFFIIGDKIQPSMENSIDFGELVESISDQPYEDAVNFIEQRKDSGMYFEIICGR